MTDGRILGVEQPFSIRFDVSREIGGGGCVFDAAVFNNGLDQWTVWVKDAMVDLVFALV